MSAISKRLFPLNSSYNYIGIGITDSPGGKVIVQNVCKKIGAINANVPEGKCIFYQEEFFRRVPNSKLIITMARRVINPPTSWIGKTLSFKIR